MAHLVFILELSRQQSLAKVQHVCVKFNIRIIFEFVWPSSCTILVLGTPEQVVEWLPMAYSMKITGCLGQTELGHGSNVRGLQVSFGNRGMGCRCMLNH